MASEIYHERHNYFQKLRSDALEVLSHIELETPQHAYIDTLREMADYATFGIIDPINGMVYNESTVFDESVVIVPMLERDLKLGEISLSHELVHDPSSDAIVDLSLHSSGFCAVGENFLSPIICMKPRFRYRCPVITGITVVHELDHAYWWINRAQMHKFGDGNDELSTVEQEISAHRLEQQLFFAHAPDLYNQEYSKVSLLFSDLDFSRPYNLRDTDKLRKGARFTALINFILDELGGDVGVKPNDEVCAALKAQDIY